MTPGDLDTPLEWECHAGHVFRATPRIVLKGRTLVSPTAWATDGSMKRKHTTILFRANLEISK